MQWLSDGVGSADALSPVRRWIFVHRCTFQSNVTKQSTIGIKSGCRTRPLCFTPWWGKCPGNPWAIKPACLQAFLLLPSSVRASNLSIHTSLACRVWAVCRVSRIAT